MLCDFFRINMPYGIKSNEKGQWSAFNREYLPLGWNHIDLPNAKTSFVWTSYPKLTEKVLLLLADYDEHRIRRNDQGKIEKVWLYNDRTNPVNTISKAQKRDNFALYFEKIKRLSDLQAKEENPSRYIDQVNISKDLI